MIGAAVSTAVKAWRLALTGRFRLLDQWCAFVQVYVLLKYIHMYYACLTNVLMKTQSSALSGFNATVWFDPADTSATCYIRRHLETSS